MGAFDDLIPGADDDGLGGSFDDLIPRDRKVGFTEAVPRMAGKALAESTKHAGLALSGPAVLADKAISLFTDKPVTGAEDFLFNLFVDPSQRSIDTNRLQPGEVLDTGGKAGAVVGGLAGALPDMLMGGAAVNSVPRVAAPAMQSTARAIADALMSGVTASQPMAQTQAVTTVDDLTAEGVDPATARNAAAREFAVNSLGMANPVGATGGLVKRALSGAGTNVVGGAAGDVAANTALPVEKQRPVLDPTARGTDAAIGAVVAALLGQRAPRSLQEEGARVGADYRRDADLWETEEGAARQRAADNEEFRAILEANGITNMASPEADQAVAALKARKVRKGEAAAKAKADAQAETPPEQRPEQRAPAETMYGTEDGRVINPNDRSTQAGFLSAEGTRASSDVQARRAFDVADAQARRKQDAQDRSAIVAEETGEPIDQRDLSEARAGGSTTREGSDALRPETFTFLDAKIRNGAMEEGSQVEILETGLSVTNAKGKAVDATRIRMEDGSDAVVETARLSQASRPENPRFAQDISATTYAPKPGVGTGEQQPSPRKAGQRITTEPSQTVYAGPERRKAPDQPKGPRAGEDVSDLAFDRVRHDPTVHDTPGTDVTVQGRPRPHGLNRLDDPRQPQDRRLPAPDDERPGGAIRDGRRETYDQMDRRRSDERVQDYSRRDLGNTNPEATAQRARSQEQARRDRQEAEFEDALRPRAQAAQPEPVAPKGRNLIAEVRKWGGIKSSEASDIAGEKGFRANSGNRSLFRKDGLGIDDVALYMHERGWLTDEEFNTVDGGTQRARDMIGDAMRGEEVFHPSELDRRARFEADQRAYNEAASRSGLSSEDVPDVEAAARAAELDPEAFDRAVREFENDDAGFDDAVRRILDGNEGAEDRQRGEAGERDAQEPGGRERPDLELRGETEAEIRAREQAQADADARANDEAVKADRKAKAERDRDGFQLTGSDRKADENPGQRDLGDSSRDSDFGPGTLRFGFSPNDIARAFSFLTGDAKAWGKSVSGYWESFKNIADLPKHPGGAPITRMVRAIFDTAAGDMRGTLKKYNSATANAVIDMFSAQAGGKRATGQTFHDAVLSWSNQQINKLAKALDGIEDDKAALAAVTDLVRNPGKIQANSAGKVHVAARQIRKALDDALAYMKAAGVDVGEVRDGYFPREFDLGLVTRKSTEFIQAAAQAYREGGASAKDADAMARALHNSLVFGESGSLFQGSMGAPAAPFVKGRVFGKQVDSLTHPMNKFLVNDPRIALPLYFQRVARRGETARRFGGEWEKWAEMERKIVDEGAGEALEKIKDFVAVGAGLRNPEGSKGLLKLSSVARTWSTLMFLEKATLSSLSEFVTPAIRAGNAVEMVSSLKTTVQALMKAGDTVRLKELGEDLGLLADHFMDTFNAARFSGGEPVGQFQAKVMNQYFRRIGLTQWTEATRVGALQVGQTFIRRLAKDLQGKRDVNLTKRYLAELGIAEKDADAFTKYLLGKNDGRLSSADVQGPMGDLYRTAIQRFMNQSIMSPEAISKPRWMSHPIGSIVGQLQSFNYAFWENVVKRNGRLAADAIKNDGNYTYYERARMATPALLMPLLVGVAYGIGEARDALLGDPKKLAQESGAQKMLKAISRGAPLAPIDPILNWISSARYQRGAIDSFSGPLPARLGQGLDATAALINKNDPNSNKAERRAAQAVYDLVLEPLANLLLSAAPVAPLSAAATQAVGSNHLRDAFVTAVAGADKTKHKGDKPKVY